MIARADACGTRYAPPELRVPAPISSRPVVRSQARRDPLAPTSNAIGSPKAATFDD